MENINDLFNKGPVVLFKWRNAEGWPVEMVSDNVIGLLGYSGEELKDEHFKYITVVHPEDSETVAQEVEQFNEQELVNFTHQPYRLITKYGDIIWVKDHTHIIRNERGEITHYVGYLYDITDQIASENQKEVAQRKLKSTLTSIDELIFVLDEKGYFREFYSNKEDENLVTPPEVFLNKHYSEVIEPENSKLIEESLQKVVETKHPAVFDYTKEVEGKLKYFSAKITPNIDEHNEKSNFTIVISDNTERVLSEIKIREYYELFSKSNDLLSISTFDGKVDAVNPLWENKFGYTLDYINQKGFLFFVHPDDKDHAYSELNRIKTDRPPVVKFDCRVKTKDGSFIWTEWVSTLDYSNKKVYSVTRDVSESKEDQAKAERVSDGLFNLVKKSLLHGDSLKEFLKTVAVEACDLLQLDRFTYWAGDNRSALECIACYDVIQGDFLDLTDLPIARYPNYFKAVGSQRITSSTYPRTDTRFEELIKDYFDPHEIKSTMDASIIGDEGLIGVLCAETISKERDWNSTDKKDLSSIAEIIRTALFVEQKNQTENELKKSRTLMYALADKMPGLVHIKEPDGKHLYGNTSTLEFFGLSLDEYRNTTHYDLFEETFADKLSQDDLNCVKQGKTIYNTLKDPFGQDKYYEEYKFPITIPNESALVGGIVIEVTDRKKAEKELIDSEAKYKMLVEFANAVHWKLDVEKSEFTYMDDKILELTGYPASEFNTLEQWASKIPPTERDSILLNCDLLSQKGEDYDLVYRNIKPDGEIVWIKDSVSVIMEKGKPVSLVGYMIDVTKQKNAELKLIESEKKFRSLVNDIQVGIIVQDAKSKILLSNSRALDLLDLTEDQLVGKTSFDPHWNVIHSDGSPFDNEDFPVPTAIRQKSPVTDSIMGVYRPKMGDRVWLQVDATPQINEDGDVAEVICTFVDITKRIIAEKERNESFINLQLAEKIAEIGYWSYDPVEDEQVWSDQVYRIFEVSKNDYKPVYGKQSYRMRPEDVQMLDDARHKAIHEGLPYDVTLKYNYGVNQFKWIRIICQTSEIEGSKKYLSRGTAQDITAQKQAQEELLVFTRLQTLLMDLSSRYINMPSQQVHDSVSETLKRLGEFVGVDRAYIFEYSSDYKTSTCINNWVREGVAGIAIDQPFEMAGLEEYFGSHINGEHYGIEDIDTLENSKIRDHYKSLNIMSMFTVPMMLHEQCIGFIGFDAVQEKKSFTPRETDLLKLFAELLVNLRQKVSYETSLVQKQGDLEIALQEKDTLFKELHHRIKNNLQLISSLLYIKLDGVSDPAMSSFINETIARILSISKIHDQLLRIEEVYELNIKDYLEELTENIIRTYCENPSLYPLSISVENAKFHIDDVLLVGLLINESVSNIIKYAYDPESGGEIRVALEITSENDVTISVADKGVGLPFDSLDDASQSNGIQLIRIFAEQLKGKLSLVQTQGTEYQIHFGKRR